MSELVPSVLPLEKGLDLQSPKLTAPPGSVLDSLNYEQVDFQGQKRIDGYARYDGTPIAALSDVLLVPTSAELYTTTSSEGLPYKLAFHDSNLLGIVTTTEIIDSIEYDVVCVIDNNQIPAEALWASTSNLLTAEQHTAYTLAANAVLRDFVGELPGPISGLHWFIDRLYAVVDIETYSPDDVKINTSGNASLFMSRSIQQVLEEDAPGPYTFGWKFVHQGWKVLFENGSSLYGKLPAINQNRQGVGVEGPTSIELNNGAASTLTQNVVITNATTQVNGWKDSSTSTTYTLNPAAIQYDDTAYVYADAYIAWDAEEGTVVGDTTPLVEYSPTNTIEMPA